MAVAAAGGPATKNWLKQKMVGHEYIYIYIIFQKVASPAFQPIQRTKCFVRFAVTYIELRPLNLAGIACEGGWW